MKEKVIMNGNSIHDILVERGEHLLNEPRVMNPFTKVPEADAFLNDLDAQPHAFVLACIMDRQMKAERAWLIPYKISVKNNGFSMQSLSLLSQLEIQKYMSEPEPLHRFVDLMSQCFYSAVQRIKNVYGSDASRIWKENLSSAEIVYRFLEFDGVGPKIANMAVNILVREFKRKLEDYSAIDISADIHVRRVFARLGFCAPNASVDQVIYKAKALNPPFPGIMDMPCFEIGRNWCKAQKPDCSGCYMKDLCPTAIGDNG